MFWHCFSDLCGKSNESLTMFGIKDKAGSLTQCKTSDIPLVWKTGPSTIGGPSIKIA